MEKNRMKVINMNGTKINYEAAVELMDDERSMAKNGN